jgi:hypothetical protein
VSAEFRAELCRYVATTYRAEGRTTSVTQVLLERHLGRVSASVEKLDDKIYEAAVNGLDDRVRYLEWCRGQVPRWMAEAEERATRRAEA